MSYIHIEARENDTLWKIAKAYGTSAGELIQLNQGDQLADITPSCKLKGGTVLMVPELKKKKAMPELKKGQILLFPRNCWYKLKGLELKFAETNPCRPGFTRYDRYESFKHCTTTDEYFKLQHQTYRLKRNEARQELKDLIQNPKRPVSGAAVDEFVDLCSVHDQKARKRDRSPSPSNSDFLASEDEDDAEKVAQMMVFLAERPETRAAAVSADGVIEATKVHDMTDSDWSEGESVDVEAVLASME